MNELSVIRAGFLTTVQDLGRVGYRQVGVGIGGAIDSHALRVANLLVGNDDNAAGLEIAFGNLRLRFCDERLVAWAGGDFEVRVGTSPISRGRASFVRANEELSVGKGKTGCRLWLAISGGIDVPVILNSRSTDVRGRFGGLAGRSLRDGDELSLGRARHFLFSEPSRTADWSAPVAWTSTDDADMLLRFVRGKDWDFFTRASQLEFTDETYAVSTDSDRMGARLTGANLFRANDSDLISEPVSPGTIQVPRGGLPIILLGGQTIGGYPKIGHVIAVDMPLVAQLCPGTRVRFSEVSIGAAHQLFWDRENLLDRFRVGLNLRLS